MKRLFLLCVGLSLVLSLLGSEPLSLENDDVKLPDDTWTDTEGHYINAHGGGILKYNGRYYWYGECRPEQGFFTEGINCYSSDNLCDWCYEGVALPVSRDSGDIEWGCIMERPKVVYNQRTNKFVMWFHLELKGQGYDAARAAVAVSDNPEGPYHFLRSGRVNPGIYPENMPESERTMKLNIDDYTEWTPEWEKAVVEGLYTQRDLVGGQMSRDMTIYVDDDGKAYHIYSSEENLTLQIAELTDDFSSHTGRYIRVAPMGHNEAPAIFKRAGTYWLITSGCTGWTPNAARLFSAPSIWGPWTQYSNPCRGSDSECTFGSQSTYVLVLPNGDYLFMADIWKPHDLMHSGYLWLTICFDESGTPYLEKP